MQTSHTEIGKDLFIEWLNRIESTIFHEIVLTHDNPEGITFKGFDESTDGDTVLIAPDMHADLYLHYIGMKIDTMTGETDRLNVSTALFSSAYQSFADFYNRTHMPIATASRYNY